MNIFSSLIRFRTFLLFMVCTIGSLSASTKFFSLGKEELSCSKINSIMQDSYGFIWISTEHGLNKYDGNKFTQFVHQRHDALSLSDNYINFTFEDSEKRLWINGIQIFDRQNLTFNTVSYFEKKGDYGQPHVTAMIERSNKELLVGSTHAIFCSHIEDEHPVMHHCNERFNIVEGTKIIVLYEDHNDNIWIGTEAHGLKSCTKSGKNIQLLYQQKKLNCISSITEDSSHNLYFGSLQGGLFVLKNGETELRKLRFPELDKYSIYTLLWDDEREVLLIGTDGNGIKAYSPDKDELTAYHINNIPFRMGNQKVHSLMRDSSGNLWVGLYQKGVILVPKNRYNFDYYGYRTFSNHNLIGNCYVMALYRGQGNCLWVGTDNDGLYAVDLSRNTSQHWNPETYPRTIMDLIMDKKGRLWIATYHDGLYYLDKTGTIWHHFPLDKDVTQRISCLTICDDFLWAGTYGSGVLKINLNNFDVDYYNTSNSILTDSWITSIYTTPSKEILIGCSYGMFRYDGHQLIDCLSVLSKDVVARSVNCFLVDLERNMWFGTRDGLYYYSSTDRKIVHFSEEDGLPSGEINRIAEDEAGNLWISTMCGISKYKIRERTFINFSQDDGLQGDDFSKAFCRDDAGRFFFGGINGISSFLPAAINDHDNTLGLTLTDILVYDRPIGRSLDETEFKLSHKDNSFTMCLSAFEFGSSENIIYQYRINDPKGEWHQIPNHSNQLSLIKMHPGTYRIDFRVCERHNISPVKTYTVTVLPPWFRTGWAWCIWLLLVLIAFYLIYLQIRSVATHKRNVDLYRQQEEFNENKLQFFINISNEIRTPLMLITAPMEKLIQEESEKRPIYQMMYRNTQRVLKLLNQLLDIRRIDKMQLKLSFSRTNLVSYIENVIMAFSYFSQKKQIEVQFHHAQQEVWAYIDTGNFDKILSNLLSNAFKYTPDRGEISISLVEKREEKVVEIVVEDTGIGINKDQIEHIFERFYQGNTSLGKVNSGTGIGLHLCRLLTQLHHGSITAEQRSDKSGSRFIVRLPSGHAHLSSEEIVEHPETVKKAANDVTSEDISMDPEYEQALQEMQHTTVRPKKALPQIVIVANDFESRQYLSDALDNEYDTLVFSDGANALQEIVKNKCQLVISNVVMNEMDGMALCKKIKGHVDSRHIPVILLGSKADVKEKIAGIESGADAYIAKPFEMEELRSTIRNLLRKGQIIDKERHMKRVEDKIVDEISINSNNDYFLDEVIRIINDNIDNPQLSVNQLADELKINRVQLYRVIKKLTDLTPIDLIRNIRLKQAANLLEKSDATISEITYRVGYNSVSYFSTAFKQFYGILPSDYRKERQKK